MHGIGGPLYEAVERQNHPADESKDSFTLNECPAYGPVFMQQIVEIADQTREYEVVDVDNTTSHM